jgi:CRISPR/Cas system-associated exonuclease Cas4 (RecB family)
MPMTDAKRKGRLEKYAKAIEGVLAGDFHTEPSSRVCPRCPFYFVCPK